MRAQRANLSYDQHRAWRCFQHPVRAAAQQQPFQIAPSPAAHDDQVDVFNFGNSNPSWNQYVN